MAGGNIDTRELYLSQPTLRDMMSYGVAQGNFYADSGELSIRGGLKDSSIEFLWDYDPNSETIQSILIRPNNSLLGKGYEISGFEPKTVREDGSAMSWLDDLVLVLDRDMPEELQSLTEYVRECYNSQSQPSCTEKPLSQYLNEVREAPLRPNPMRGRRFKIHPIKK